MPQDASDPFDLSRNERLILSLIRRRGPMARAALAQATGLSAQAITNLTRKLISNNFLATEKVVRGRVGQPSTPLSLSADGALFVGLKLGRRLAELALVDFAGQVKIHRQEVYPFPQPDRMLAFARHGIATFQTGLAARNRGRIAGLGIAAPFRLWDWGDEMAEWHGRDLRAELAQNLPFPVFLENDATTACGAELVFGGSNLPPDFLYLYIAHFAGGGVVLDGKLRFGPQRNAGALGSMPIAEGRQLVDIASVSDLERRLGRALPPDDAGWDVPEQIEADWARDAGRALAFVALSAVSLVDLPLIVIDGAIPAAARARLVRETRRAIDTIPAAGIDRPRVIEGSMGRQARILGAAALPLSHFFQPDGQLG
ncbi:ROK family transcriptional regulator [Paracoccus fistulariae]|uniref:ROK family transcriptional regulator n=1 Tax=Paracoccus fistulariae TaxID=658446 RepID=A0ABY7SGP1_9RHOB|nr:ROK family transcriptional regulator [Paracoccus fistulariae]MDB6180886.1 ROK family transcriptional regulator [Paracoccus fistulariae]WCR06185.1 ROK family transcriptional regulator [Paracoccus fistulariae]